MKGCIYFVQLGDSGPIKIGFTSIRLNERINNLQPSNPDALHVRGIISPASLKLEAKIHAKFSADRIRGEWFRLSPDLADFIKSNTLPWVRRDGAGTSPRMKLVDIDFTDEQASFIESEAEATGLGRSEIVRRLIDEYFEKQETKK